MSTTFCFYEGCLPDAHFQFNILESDIRPKLTLVAEIDMDNDGLLGIIRKADRSFEPISPGGFRAVNRDGYMVDLIKSAPKQLFRKEICRMGGPSDMEAVEIRNLQWLISSPKFSQVVIGDDGYPAPLVVPDPRTFALHKSPRINKFHHRDRGDKYGKAGGQPGSR